MSKNPINSSAKNKASINFNNFVLLCQKHDNSLDLSVFDDYTTKILNEYCSKYISNIIDIKKISVINTILRLNNLMIFNFVKIDKFFDVVHAIDKNIDLNALNKFGQNCLFHLGSVTKTMTMLKSELNIDINQTDDSGNTCIMYLKLDLFTGEEFDTIVSLLQRKKYNFNLVNKFGECFLTKILDNDTIGIANKKILLKKVINVPEYNILINPHWLFMLLRKELSGSTQHASLLNNIMRNIVNKTDNNSLLCELLHNYHFQTAEDDIIYIMTKIKYIDSEKLISMLAYQDSDENTFVHIAAKHHYKKVLVFITNFMQISVGANKEGKYPVDLYRDGKIKN